MRDCTERDAYCPLGACVVIGTRTDGDHLEWVTYIKATGEPWQWRNKHLRFAPHVTGGRPRVSGFPGISLQLQQHIDRYKKNGWLP